MANEAHHDTHHVPAETRPTTSFRSAYWFVIILAGLFIAAVNFVSVMSHDEEVGHATAEHGAAGHESISHDEKDLEHGPATGAAHSAEHEATAPTTDTAHHEAAAEEAHH